MITKIMSIIGIVISVIGLFGSLALAEDDFGSALIAFVVYAFFLAFSIIIVNKEKK